MKDREGTSFTNVIEGGLSKRDYIAIEILKGMIANVQLSSTTMLTLRKNAIVQADLFVEELSQ